MSNCPHGERNRIGHANGDYHEQRQNRETLHFDVPYCKKLKEQKMSMPGGSSFQPDTIENRKWPRVGKGQPGVKLANSLDNRREIRKHLGVVDYGGFQIKQPLRLERLPNCRYCGQRLDATTWRLIDDCL